MGRRTGGTVHLSRAVGLHVERVVPAPSARKVLQRAAPACATSSGSPPHDWRHSLALNSKEQRACLSAHIAVKNKYQTITQACLWSCTSPLWSACGSTMASGGWSLIRRACAWPRCPPQQRCLPHGWPATPARAILQMRCTFMPRAWKNLGPGSARGKHPNGYFFALADEAAWSLMHFMSMFTPPTSRAPPAMHCTAPATQSLRPNGFGWHPRFLRPGRQPRRRGYLHRPDA